MAADKAVRLSRHAEREYTDYLSYPLQACRYGSITRESDILLYFSQLEHTVAAASVNNILFILSGRRELISDSLAATQASAAAAGEATAAAAAAHSAEAKMASLLGLGTEMGISIGSSNNLALATGGRSGSPGAFSASASSEFIPEKDEQNTNTSNLQQGEGSDPTSSPSPPHLVLQDAWNTDTNTVSNPDPGRERDAMSVAELASAAASTAMSAARVAAEAALVAAAAAKAAAQASNMDFQESQRFRYHLRVPFRKVDRLVEQSLLPLRHCIDRRAKSVQLQVCSII
jgi:hypothetical protein